MDDTQSKILDIAPQLQNAQTVLDRMTVRAPTEGKVVSLSVHTVGAVVAPGAVIMDIVPELTSLVVQARVAVQDISDLRPGMKAEVRFTSYKQRSTPLIRGTVAEISADRITDEKTLAVYYQTQVNLDPADLAANPEIELYPGMPTTVMVTTEERTALDYFLGPLINSFDHAFKQK
jgi:epimerase transport system membrane fusion protein